MYMKLLCESTHALEFALVAFKHALRPSKLTRRAVEGIAEHAGAIAIVVAVVAVLVGRILIG